MPLRDGPIFYVDESIYSHALITALRKDGIEHTRVGVAVPAGAADEVWLEAVGKNGWFALTRDQRIRYRPLERQALVRHGVGVFTFTGGQATGEQTALRICALMPKFKHLCTKERRPFLFTFGLMGSPAKVTLIKPT